MLEEEEMSPDEGKTHPLLELRWSAEKFAQSGDEDALSFQSLRKQKGLREKGRMTSLVPKLSD